MRQTSFDKKHWLKHRAEEYRRDARLFAESQKKIKDEHKLKKSVYI